MNLLKTVFRWVSGFILLIPIILVVSCSGGGSSGGSDGGPDTGSDNWPRSVQIPAAASRTSGVAPLGVFFNAAIDSDSDAFHTLDYTWGFDDPTSGTWADSGVSKNGDKGPVAAHVFDNPGLYTVTLTVRDGSGIISTESFDINVEDPDTRYADSDTVCISSSDANDFSGCPAGSHMVVMDDIDALGDHIDNGKRVLLRRGDNWTTSGSWRYANMDGPVTIGAYGECQSPDARGICANAPRIQLTGDVDQGMFSLYRVTDWRIQDLHLAGETSRWGAIGGNTDLKSILLLRLRVTGFNVPLGNSHWETDGHDQFMIVDSDVSASGTNEVYIGSERLVLMGNNFRNPGQSHVLRVWQAYFGVIGHNTLSGSSQDSSSGRHALKFHGPSMAVLANAGDGAGGLVNPTRFVVVGDNIFGGSGPWPVAIGPQDGQQDERLQDIIVEKNRFFPGYGDPSCCSSGVQVALNIWARDVTVRNNIFDGEASSIYFTAINVGQRGNELTPTGNRIYNNTIYKADLLPDNDYTGVRVQAAATNTIVRNNLVYLPTADSNVEIIRNDSVDLVSDHNLLTETPGLADPDHADLLQKDYHILAGSPAENQGADVPLWDDFAGTNRPRDGYFDVGAYER